MPDQAEPAPQKEQTAEAQSEDAVPEAIQPTITGEPIVSRRKQPPRNSSNYTYPARNNSIGNFLKEILPQNFDTEDLIVVLLLLLMSGNSASDQNAAMLTLCIYLFL